MEKEDNEYERLFGDKPSAFSNKDEVLALKRIRIEEESQSIRHIDPAGQARVQLGLLFWDENDPFSNGVVDVYDEKERIIFYADTDIDGRASIEFLANIIDETRRELRFVFPGIDAKENRIFIIKDDADKEVCKNIDDLRLRHDFWKAREEVIANFGGGDSWIHFLVKYQGRVPNEWIKEVKNSLKKEQEINERAPWRALRLNDDPKQDYIKGGIFNRYGIAVFTCTLEKPSSMLIDGRGRQISARFHEINSAGDSLWSVVYFGKRYFINNQGNICDENGNRLNTRNYDKDGFPLPDPEAK